MKSLSLLQKIAVYTGLISALTFGAYKCGSDYSQPDPTEDAQVEVDAGYDAGTLEDVVNTPDADKDVLDSDVSNGDNYQPDTDVKDGGVDADLTDIPYVDGGDVDLTDTYNPDSGDVILTDAYIQPDGGDDVSDGGDVGQVKAVLKYLVNQYSSNPADYQDQPKTVNIIVGDKVFYSACDSTGDEIAGYKLTDDKGLDQIIPKSDCLIGAVGYYKKNTHITKLQPINTNSQPIGSEDILTIIAE